jgi:hypothetical protein
MIKLYDMLVRMYSLSVWDSTGKQYLPVFDYEWRYVSHYEVAKSAIETNWNNYHSETVRAAS